jgi:RNA polymerase sigma-70 factor, ECF subfamily
MRNNFLVTKSLFASLYSESANPMTFARSPMTESDRHYIERCLDGHPDDYRYLVERYKSMLIASLTGRLGNRDWGEEAAQETLVRAYFNMAKLKKPDSFIAWLLGIANRVAKEHRRRKKDLLRNEDVSSVLELAAPAEPKTDLELQRAIAALPDAYREVILLRFYGERSCNQIADQLDISLTTVTKRLSRAYVLLRESLQRDQAGNQEVPNELHRV